MILEHVYINIQPDETDDYQRAFQEARPLVLSQPGCKSCLLLPNNEVVGSFLLLIEWEKKTDHTEGFRKSEAYQKWSALLHPFYKVHFPRVSYFALPNNKSLFNS